MRRRRLVRRGAGSTARAGHDNMTQAVGALIGRG
jgi:hypothetical protein